MAEPRISRRALSRRVQWLNWRSASGAWQEGGCRKALAELDRRQVLELPAPRTSLALWQTPVLAVDDTQVCRRPEALARAEWYAARWGIEVFHRTLKSGCRIKDRQLGTAERLQACLGVNMVVAWRIYHLTMLGREMPEHPCTAFFEEVEWKALYCYHYKTPVAPEEPPSIGEAIRMLGAMGGHLG